MVSLTNDKFPIYPKENKWDSDPDCILATGSNIRWLLTVMEINQTDIMYVRYA